MEGLSVFNRKNLKKKQVSGLTLQNTNTEYNSVVTKEHSIHAGIDKISHRTEIPEKDVHP